MDYRRDSRVVQALTNVDGNGRKVVEEKNHEEGGLNFSNLKNKMEDGDGGSPAMISVTDAEEMVDPHDLAELEVEKRLLEWMEKFAMPKLEAMDKRKIFDHETNMVRARTQLRVRAARDMNLKSVGKYVKENKDSLAQEYAERRKGNKTMDEAFRRKNVAKDDALTRLASRLNTAVPVLTEMEDDVFDYLLQAESELLANQKNWTTNETIHHHHPETTTYVPDRHHNHRVELPGRDGSVAAWKAEAMRRPREDDIFKATDSRYIDAAFERFKEDENNRGIDEDDDEEESKKSPPKNLGRTSPTNGGSAPKPAPVEAHEYFMRPIGALANTPLFHGDWFVPSLRPTSLDPNHPSLQGAGMMQLPSIFDGPNELGEWETTGGGHSNISSNGATAKNEYGARLQEMLQTEFKADLNLARSMFDHANEKPELSKMKLKAQVSSPDLDLLLEGPLLLYEPPLLNQPVVESFMKLEHQEQMARDDMDLERLHSLIPSILDRIRSICPLAHQYEDDDHHEAWLQAHISQFKGDDSVMPNTSSFNAGMQKLVNILMQMDLDGLFIVHLLETLRNADNRHGWKVGLNLCLKHHLQN